jgi:hypothetical protein
MKSSHDNPYASTVRRAPKAWWERLLALDRREDTRRRPAKRAVPRRSVWALKGPEDLG